MQPVGDKSQRTHYSSENRYSLKQKLLYSTILLVFAILAVEASLHLVYAILTHKPFPFSWYDETISRLASSVKSPEAHGELRPGEMRWQNQLNDIVEVLHPYLGFVVDPTRTPHTSYLGFPGENDDPLSDSPGSLTVAIFGGSFAGGTAGNGRAALASTLHDYGIDARILTIAAGGYKQPQQLLALAYLLSHGAELDVVVNIDGFNEVALPQAENVPKGVNPFYPRSWYERTLLMTDEVAILQVGRVATLQDARRRWAAVFRDMPKFSIVRNVAWRAYDLLLEQRIMDGNEQIRQSRPLGANQFLTVGPDFQISNDAELYERIADHWAASSLLMKALCDAHGSVYVHILQPNQYFETDRTLTQEEKRSAFEENHIYRPGVVKGYPKLLAAKAGLITQGVNFHDLTKIYDDIQETIYQDSCCHPTDRGYEMVAKYVAHRIGEAIEQHHTG